MNPRPDLTTVAVLAWLALAPALFASGGRPSPSPIPVFVASPSPRSDGPPWPLRLQLVHRIDLDRNNTAAAPNDRSMMGRAPAVVVAAGAIPPIVSHGSSILFIAPDGTILDRIDTKADPNVAAIARVSENLHSVAIGRSLRVGEPDFKSDGGSLAQTFTIYDRTGRALYSTQKGGGDLPQLADSGHVVFANIHTGELTFVEHGTGRDLARFQFLGRYGSGRAYVAISADGQRVLTAAITTSLDGDRSVRKYYENPARYEKDAVTECWAGLFDARGRELWKVQLPGVKQLDNLALSSDGRVAFVHGMGDPEGPGRRGNRGFLLGEDGRIVGTSNQWGGGGLQASFRPELQSFEMSPPAVGIVDLLRTDGALTTLFIHPSREPRLRDTTFHDRSRGGDLVAWLGLRKERLVLILVRSDGKVLLIKKLPTPGLRGGDGDDADPPDDEDGQKPSRARFDELANTSVSLAKDGTHVTVRLRREIRTWRILPRAATGGDR